MPALVPGENPSAESWIKVWQELQPLRCFKNPEGGSNTPETLLRPATCPEDWMLFWKQPLTDVFILLGLRQSFLTRVSSMTLVRGDVMDMREWTAWVGDV